MKLSEIKNLIRYCITKVQETGCTVDTKYSFVEWNHKQKKWVSSDDSICPLNCLLLVRQPEPTAENILENYRLYPASLVEEQSDFKKKALRHLLKGSDYRCFPETLALDTIQETLGVSREFLYGFIDGSVPVTIKSRSVLVLPSSADKKPGWQVGFYFYTRLHKDPVSVFYEPILQVFVDNTSITKHE